MEDNLRFHAKGNDTSPEHIFKNLIDSLDLATSLRVKSCAEENVGTHGLLKRIPKLRGEDVATILRYQLRNAVQRDNPGGI